MSAFKLRPRSGNAKPGTDSANLIEDVKAIVEQKCKDHVIRVIVLSAPMADVVPFLSHAEKPSEELEKLQKDITAMEIHEVTLLPSSQLEGKTMNFTRGKP